MKRKLEIQQLGREISPILGRFFDRPITQKLAMLPPSLAIVYKNEVYHGYNPSRSPKILVAHNFARGFNRDYYSFPGITEAIGYLGMDPKEVDLEIVGDRTGMDLTKYLPWFLRNISEEPDVRVLKAA